MMYGIIFQHWRSWRIVKGSWSLYKQLVADTCVAAVHPFHAVGICLIYKSTTLGIGNHPLYCHIKIFHRTVCIDNYVMYYKLT
jgi:hypothetical protein